MVVNSLRSPLSFAGSVRSNVGLLSGLAPGSFQQAGAGLRQRNHAIKVDDITVLAASEAVDKLYDIKGLFDDVANFRWG